MSSFSRTPEADLSARGFAAFAQSHSLCSIELLFLSGFDAFLRIGCTSTHGEHLMAICSCMHVIFSRASPANRHERSSKGARANCRSRFVDTRKSNSRGGRRRRASERISSCFVHHGATLDHDLMSEHTTCRPAASQPASRRYVCVRVKPEAVAVVQRSGANTQLVKRPESREDERADAEERDI